MFPLYVSIVDEYGLHEEHYAFFKQNKLSYVVLDLDTQFRGGEVKVRYKEYHPCYTITVQNAEELRLVLNKTYWLASEICYIPSRTQITCHLSWGRQNGGD